MRFRFGITDWTMPGLQEALAELVSEGQSARQIAFVLSERFRLALTRNSIIGQCHRTSLQLAGKRHPPARRPPAAKALRIAPTFKTSAKEREQTRARYYKRNKPKREKAQERVRQIASYVEQQVTLVPGEPLPLGIDTACAWLHGEPAQRLFCGHPRQEGSSYCSHHDARCYRGLVNHPAQDREAA